MRNWRVPVRWYLIILALPILLSVVSLAVVFVLGGFSAGPFQPKVLILLHGWNSEVQSYLVLSQPNLVAQVLYSVLPWGLAIILSKNFGDENLSDRSRAVWWPGRYEGAQRAG